MGGALGWGRAAGTPAASCCSITASPWHPGQRECWPAGGLDCAKCSPRSPGEQEAAWSSGRGVQAALGLMVITLGPGFLNRLSSHHRWPDPALDLQPACPQDPGRSSLQPCQPGGPSPGGSQLCHGSGAHHATGSGPDQAADPGSTSTGARDLLAPPPRPGRQAWARAPARRQSLDSESANTWNHQE